MRVLVEKHVNDIMYKNPGVHIPLTPLCQRLWLLPMCYIIMLKTKTITMLLREFFPLLHQLINNLLVIKRVLAEKFPAEEANRKNKIEK